MGETWGQRLRGGLEVGRLKGGHGRGNSERGEVNFGGSGET